MEKVKKLIKGKQRYLLGKDADGVNYCLEEPSWDCGWYWGFGYVQTFTNNAHPELSRDIRSHQHFDGLFLNGPKNGYDMFKEFFKESVLTDAELWQFIDLMKSFYALQETAELFRRGYSYYTEKAKTEELKDEALAKRINEVMLPAIFKKIDALLS